MHIVQRKKNVQTYPSKAIFFPNDRFSKKIATLTDDDFQEMNTGESRNLVELNHHKKFGKILSPFRIFVDEHSSLSPNPSSNSTSPSCASPSANTTSATASSLPASSIALSPARSTTIWQNQI